MRKLILSVAILFLVSFFSQAQGIPDLGKAGAYTVLAGAGVVNTGDTKIDGNLGVSPGTVYTGLLAGQVKGREDINNAAAAEAQADLALAYQQAVALLPTQNLTGQSLVRRVLTPGVYRFDGPLTHTDTLFLDNRANVGGTFIFQVNGDLNLADFAVVKFLKTAKPRTKDVFWQVAGQVTMGASSMFLGNLLVNEHITLGSSAKVQGRLLSRTGTITLATNQITIPTDIAVEVTLPQDQKYTIGDNVPLTITARNNGPLAVNAMVKMTISPGLTYVSSAPAGQFDPTTGQWLLSDFTDGELETIQIVVKVNPSATAITEFVRATIDFNGMVDEIIENNTATRDICVAPTVPSTITGPAAACVGSEVSYSIAPVSGATGYFWSYPLGWTVKSGTSDNTNSITLVVGANGGEVRVIVRNVCTESLPSIRPVATSLTPPPAPGPIKTDPVNVDPCVDPASPATAVYAIDPVATAISYQWKVPATGGWEILSGQGTTSISVRIGTAAGKITVAAVNGCPPISPASELAVTPSVNPPVIPEAIEGELAPCIGVEATYTVSGGSGATAYVWTLPDASWVIKSGQNTSSIVVVVGSTGGNITVKGTNGCGTTEEQTLAVAPITNTPPDAITGPLTPCLKSKGNVYSVAARPGTIYFWSAPGLTITEGQNTNSIKVNVGDNVASATISVIAINSCGPSAETKLTVIPARIPDMPQPITAPTPQPCAGQTDLVFSISPVAGATEYVWTLPAGGGWAIVGPATGTSITVTAGSTPGLLEVRAKNNCDAGPARTLALSPSVAVPAGTLQITGKNNVCVSGIGEKPQESYLVSALPDVTAYAWEVPADWQILSGQGTTQILVAVGATPGPVKVAATNNCGKGVEASLDVAISTTPSPAPGPIISSTAIPCVLQENITYSVPAVNGAFSYKWAITGDWQILSGNGTTAITVKAGTVPATISVKAVNDCGDSGSSTLELIPSTQEPAVPVAITGPSAVCVGQQELTYSVASVTQATTYQWQVPAGWNIVAGQGSPSITVAAGTAGGTILVAAGNNCGNSQAQALAVQVSTVPPAAAGPISGPGNLCAGRSGLTFSIAEVSGATSYTWSVPTGWTIDSGQGSTTVVVTAGPLSGKIRVKPQSGCGEGPGSELAVTPTNGLPVMPGAIVGSLTICAEEKNLSYVIPPMTGVSTYNWTVPTGWTITAGQGTSAITVTAGSGGGEISVTAFNNCGASPARSLALNPGLIPAVPLAISGQAIPCAGSTGNTYSVAAVPGATDYQWSVPAGWTITAGQGSNQITVAAGSNGGDIGVQAGNSCGRSLAALLPVTPSSTVPAIPGTIQGSSSVCGSSLDLTYTYSVAAETNASNYIWSVPNGWQITSGQGTLQISVKASTSPGTISVMAENGCGLSMVSILAVSVTGQAPPKPGLVVGSKTVCEGQQNLTYTVGSVSGAASYTWAVPADWTIISGQGSTTLQVQAGRSGGDVSVTATNGCGNSTASALAVALNNLPQQPLAIAGEPHQCAGNTGSVYRVEPLAGALSYTWTVPADWTITAGQGTPVITITAGQASGEVSVKANSDCGSSQAQVLAVTSSTTPSPAPGRIIPAYGGLICSQQDGLTYTIDPVATATSYAWSVPEGWTITAGQGSTAITVTAGSGTGLISVKALNGCGESLASSLPVAPAQTASVDIGALSGEPSICAGRSGLVYAVAPVAGATNYQWLLPPGWTITAGAGTHQVTVTAGREGGRISVTAANTCASSLPATLEIQVQAQVVAPVAIRDISTPCGGLSYTLEPEGENQSYTWTLPDGWTITAGAGTSTILVEAPAGSGKGLLTVVADNGNCSSEPLSLEADPARAQAETVIANVFSPNGDGVNDTWEILNIQNYPDNDLVIINRWGNEVYRRKAYRNQWDGGQLSAGTYYYVLKMKVCDGSYKSYKGYVMIMR